ncbi:MAG: low affinity iron permease family protein [Chelatococcus sp.]|jgi:low affinity Fe/Cu permease|uniref:low affinity iron permease family protein n=1 Tax=unclassified Chelatococcus TaxID=2638111 RepID=UPI001BCAD51D|nr:MULTISPECIES: low affinity iron permease family protein [unclassified Chelatococcus]CAH1660511.1 Low affinity Fe/Cu permease [Hyphomicrobiales bacterium]MBS7741122.1 low affinity iron permease family protein [Chelatococcus sp. HY11]MBX3539856.1 low affinity iron permease family protein [Chelatococcus sp.]MBX3545308.1 low affinity iron permease family protein [Chelatococcus sp.]MCO5077941.1 low affinity iron permease family protein [Chelatococcus sp.]
MPQNGPQARAHSNWFGHFASKTARLAGSPAVFAAACIIVVVWAISGPFLGFSEVWQLTINTGTTIITFLMVFIIQNTQNRDAQAMHIKLDELIRATSRAQNSLLDLEELSEKELDDFRNHYQKLAEKARRSGLSITEALERAERQAEAAASGGTQHGKHASRQGQAPDEG